MKVTEFLRMFIRTCRALAKEQTDATKIRRLHHIADSYNLMLKRWFATDESHEDLPGKTIGKVKRFINENGESLELAMRELALSLIEQKGGEDMPVKETKTPSGYMCTVERPDGTTYQQEFAFYSLDEREQLKQCQKLLGPKSDKNAYWACGGYYLYE